jgi:hypothetical protein
MQRGLSATATDITWKGTSRSPTVSVSDSAGADRTSVAIFVFKESELSAGGTSFTVTFGATAFDVSVVAETVGDVDQATTVRTSGSSTNVMVAGNTADVAQTVTVGDYQVACITCRNGINGRLVPQHSWTEDLDANSGDNDGAFGASWIVATGTSSPFMWHDNNGTETASYSMVSLALIPFAGGSSIAAISSNYRMFGVR